MRRRAKKARAKAKTGISGPGMKLSDIYAALERMKVYTREQEAQNTEMNAMLMSHYPDWIKK